MSDSKLLSHAATVFKVTQVQKSAEFYRDMLGFEISFSGGEPVSYAVLKRDDISIHLTQNENPGSEPSDQTTLYIFSFNVDAVYKELTAKQVNISNPIGDREYGMRDFDIVDLDGNIISFGQGIH